MLLQTARENFFVVPLQSRSIYDSIALQIDLVLLLLFLLLAFEQRGQCVAKGE